MHSNKRQNIKVENLKGTKGLVQKWANSMGKKLKMNGDKFWGLLTLGLEVNKDE